MKQPIPTKKAGVDKMKKKIGGVLKSFTGIITGVALLPHLSTSVGGAAGKVAGLGQTFASVGIAGHAIGAFKKKR